MTSLELTLMTLAELTTTEIHKTNNSHGLNELKVDAKDGGEIASITRKNIESKIGKKIVSPNNALNIKKKIN